MAIKGKSAPGANAPGKLLRKYFGDLEIKEAQRSLTLFPVWADFKGATKHDPHNCGFARCAARVIGSSKALFFKRAVYVDHPGPDGTRRAYRYIADTHIYRVLAAFDKGKVKEKDVLKEFMLKPPPKSNQLAEKRRISMRWKKTDVGKAAVAFEMTRGKLVRLSAREQVVKAQWRKAKDAMPQSRQSQELGNELAGVRKELIKARIEFDQKRKRMADVGNKDYATGTPKPRKYDVDVRTGSRFFSLAQQ